MELDSRIVRPLEAKHAEIEPQEALRRRALLFGIRDGEKPEGAVRQEDQLAAGAQKARGLGESSDTGSAQMDAPVLAGGEVEACIGQSGRLGIAVDECEVEVVLVLERARRAELLGRVVDAGRATPRCARQATSNLVFDFGENRVRIDVLEMRKGKDRASRRNRHDLWIFGGVCSTLLRP